MKYLLPLITGIMILYGSFAIAGDSGMTEADKDNLIRQIRAIRNNELIQPAMAAPGLPIKSGSRYTMQLAGIKDELEPGLYKSLVDRPTRQTYFDTEHFRIHFDIAGTHAVPPEDNILEDGVPDYVDSTALILEYVWAFELDTLDFAGILEYGRPVPDGSDGGDSRYDVYLTNFGANGIYGMTYGECEGSDRTCQGYIEIENDFSEPVFIALGYGENPMGAVKVTAAHEFMHAIHYSLDVYEAAGTPRRYWWQEVSSVWMEDVVFDEVNDYLFSIRYFFNYPDLSLESYTQNTSDPARYMHPYASTIWARFLHEKYDRDIIRQIWQRCGEVVGYNVLSATDQILDEHYGSSFEEAFLEFTTWNYFTDNRADTVNRYSESDTWSDTISTMYFTAEVPWDTVDVSFHDENDDIPEPLSSNYLVFDTRFAMPSGGLLCWFNGEATSNPGNAMKLMVAGWDNTNDTVFQVELNPINNDGSFAFQSWKRFDQIVIIPSVFGYFYAIDDRTGYDFSTIYDQYLNDDAPILYELPAVVEVKAGDCAEIEIMAFEPNGDSIAFYTVPPSGSLDGLTITSLSDTSAMLEYCPDYKLIDSTIIIAVYARDDDMNYDTRQISFNVVYFSQSEVQEVTLVGYPNPFSYENNSSITLRYILPDSVETGEVELYIFNASGDLIWDTLYVNDFAPGELFLKWPAVNNSGNQLASGVYIAKLRTGDKSAYAKLAIIR